MESSLHQHEGEKTSKKNKYTAHSTEHISEPARDFLVLKAMMQEMKQSQDLQISELRRELRLISNPVMTGQYMQAGPAFAVYQPVLLQTQNFQYQTVNPPRTMAQTAHSSMPQYAC